MEKLLHAIDRAARQTKRNRSALVRDALLEHLRRWEAGAREERDRQGYSAQAQTTANAGLTIGAADPRARGAFTPQDKSFPVLLE
jgi:metal-responsive CopG/Arc/MetJ family transcriptional regulator